MEYRQIFSAWSETVLNFSTVVGRVWLTVLFFFRVFILMVESGTLQHDLSKDMVCNTQQPGCTAKCYNYFFPVLPTKLWCVQIIFTSTPTLLYLAYTMHVVYGERIHPKQMNGKGSMSVRKSVMISCFAQLLAKIIFEVAFIVLQYHLYGVVTKELLVCSQKPCPSSVDCYLPQSSELTVVSIYMLAVACVSAALNGLEAILLWRKLRRQHEKCGLQTLCLTDLSDKNNLSNEAGKYDLSQACN